MTIKPFRVAVACTLLSAVGWLAMPPAALAQTTLEKPGARRPAVPSRPRLAPLDETEWSDAQKALVAKYVGGGRMDNGLRTLLNVPELFNGIMPFTNYLSAESSLSARHRELLILRAAWLCGSHPLWASHAERARSAGVTTADLRRIAEGADVKGWDPFDATLIELADQLFRNSSVTDATWRALSATYDEFHLMDAVETVNHFVMLSLIYNSLGVQPDAGARDLLPTNVPYRLIVPEREPALTVARFLPLEGQGIAVGRTFRRYPKLSERWGPRQTFTNRGSKLQPHFRELLILRSGWNCRAEYEWAQHVGTVGRARDHGLDPPRIAEGQQAAVWNDLERLLLQAADELYRDAVVSDRTWNSLTPMLDTELLVSAIYTASDYRAISMSLNTYGVQLEPGNEKFPTITQP
jgi:4-carboxymuconolactone decarboxylase